MNGLETAIKKAIEGGYGKADDFKPNLPTYNTFKHWYGGDKSIAVHVVFDPLFWQALGKAEGWEDYICEKCRSVFPEYHNGCVRCGGHLNPDKNNLYHWYSLVAHLADSKDIDSFFTNLLKK